MITFDIVTPDPEDAAEITIARLRLPVLPRIGETIVLNGIPYRSDEELPENERRHGQFVGEVREVRYATPDIGDAIHSLKAPLDDVMIEVVVEALERAAWEGFTR